MAPKLAGIQKTKEEIAAILAHPSPVAQDAGCAHDSFRQSRRQAADRLYSQFEALGAWHVLP